MSQQPKPPKNGHSKIVCMCLDVTEAEVIKAIKTHKLKNIKDIAQFTQAGEGCTVCHEDLKEYLEEYGEPGATAEEEN